MNDFSTLPKLTSWQSRERNGSLQFNGGDIFDRVINLKFTTAVKEKGITVAQDSFVLRSDYELVSENFVGKVAEGNVSYSKNNKVVVRKCRLKPSIKVQYKQVSGNVSIELDIFVKNFFMFDSEGKTLMSFSNAEESLTTVDIQMGYFGQFADFYKYSESGNGTPTLKEFFDFDKKPKGVQTITCNVMYSYTESLPPDSTLHIHGYVGSCYVPPVSDKMLTEEGETIKVLKSSTDTDNVYTYEDGKGYKFKSLAHYLYNNVTRRFLRKLLSAGDTKGLKTLSVKFKENEVCLDDKSSLNYGVRIFLSESIVGDGKTDSFLGQYSLYDRDGNPIPAKGNEFIKELSGDTPMKALNSFIGQRNNHMVAQPLENGDYLLYLKSDLDNPRDISNMSWYTFDPTLSAKGIDLDGDNKVKASELGLVKKTYKELTDYVNESLGGKAKEKDITEFGKIFSNAVTKDNFSRIPAVYNIAFDNALCTITCPFFFFLQPFQKFYFRYRYVTSSMVAYYLDQENKELEFTAIWQSVSFATTENINDVQICCVPEE